MKKLIIGFVLGGLVFGGIVYAVSYNASDISYTKSSGEKINVNEALNELYNKGDSGVKLMEDGIFTDINATNTWTPSVSRSHSGYGTESYSSNGGKVYVSVTMTGSSPSISLSYTSDLVSVAGFSHIGINTTSYYNWVGENPNSGGASSSISILDSNGNVINTQSVGGNGMLYFNIAGHEKIKVRLNVYACYPKTRSFAIDTITAWK